jgi:hypothetical protein
VRDLPGSRSISRANSTTGSRQHSRGGSAEYLNPNPSAADEPGDQPPSVSRVLSTESLGPFDETRNPQTIPQEVDLNHLELTPQQIEEENLRRAGRRRRQKRDRVSPCQSTGQGRNTHTPRPIVPTRKKDMFYSVTTTSYTLVAPLRLSPFQNRLKQTVADSTITDDERTW